MSVINRMLADLEQRGAPAARGAGALHSPTRPRRVRRERRTLVSALLLVPLSAVAVALWLPPGVVRLPDFAASLVRAAPGLKVQALSEPTSSSRVLVPPLAKTIAPVPAAGAAAAGESPQSGEVASRPSVASAQSEAARRASLAATQRQQPLSLRIDSALAADQSRESDRVAQPPGATAARAARSRDVAAPAASFAPTARAQQVSTAAPAAARMTRTPVAAVAATPADPDTAADGASRVIKRAPGSLAIAGNAESAPVVPGPVAPGEVRKDDRSTSAVRAQRRYAAARDMVARGESNAARTQLRDVLALDEGHHGARELLVALLRRIGEHAQARDLLARGLELAPGRAAFATPYARLLVDAGELDHAARVLAGASASGAGDAEFHALAAAIAQQRGQHDEAVAQYTRAIETRGGREGRLWLGLGISLAANGRDDEAHRAYRSALDSGDLPPRLHDWARSRIE